MREALELVHQWLESLPKLENQHIARRYAVFVYDITFGEIRSLKLALYGEDPVSYTFGFVLDN